MKKMLSVLLAALLIMSSITVAFATEYVYASGGDCYLREGPSLSYDTVTVMEQGEKATYKNKTQKDYRGVKWYKVKFEGHTGWVSSKYATLGKSSSSETVSGKVTATGNCYVREGAGLKYDTLTVMEQGDKATYLGKSKEDSRSVTWYKVKFDGYTGWVSSKYATTGKYNPKGYKTVYASGGDSWVREGAGLKYDTIGLVTKGSRIKYNGTIKTDKRGVDWYSVQYKGENGWISSMYTKLSKGNVYTAPSSTSSTSSTSSNTTSATVTVDEEDEEDDIVVEDEVIEDEADEWADGTEDEMTVMVENAEQPLEIAGLYTGAENAGNIEISIYTDIDEDNPFEVGTINVPDLGIEYKPLVWLEGYTYSELESGLIIDVVANDPYQLDVWITEEENAGIATMVEHFES